MIVTPEALAGLRSHWAVSAIGERDLERAEQLADERLAQENVGRQIAFSFAPDHGGGDADRHDDALLDRVALAYELAAVEGLEALAHPGGIYRELREQATLASHKAFEFRRLGRVSGGPLDRILFVLRLSALAYCGDRWPDLRRWYAEHEESLKAPSVADVPWDARVLYRLFHCWVRLFRKRGWDDLDRVRETIAGLRDDQRQHEARQFEDGSDDENRVIALRLVALYHWAKATETLARYLLQGDAADPLVEIDKHFEAAIKAGSSLGDAGLDVLLRCLHASAHVMVRSALWWAVRRVNSTTTAFVRSLAKRAQPIFQLLPPQRAALLEQGLLDQAKTAIVVDMPTSGGKTLLAQFRMLQALNQFRDAGGWVAYVAPTRALCAQITRRLRRDFEPIGIRVEQLTSAVEVDAFEGDLLAAGQEAFEVLIATPEKLSLAIRNKRIERPLSLLVMDEAHNLEAEGRGLRIELFLATVRRDCPETHFLLLMPFVEGTGDIARWLAQDDSAGKAISLGTTAWKPNERILGLYRAAKEESARAGWRLEFETLTVTPKALRLRGTHRVDGVRPLGVPRSTVLQRGSQAGLSTQTAAMASVLSQRGTSIAIANRVDSVWAMARRLMNSMPAIEEPGEEVRLVQDFLRTEIADDFELVGMLDRGVGVHHAGLSDETRALMEWLAESGHLKVLCATTTIAQGIDFPVSSVFLASRHFPGAWGQVEMTPREFWNLAGRAGRLGHDSVGVVGLAEGTDRAETMAFVQKSTGALVSRLVTLLDELATEGELAGLAGVLWKDQWEDFRCYVAHLCAEAKNLDAVLADSEQLLRHTYGYATLRADPERKQQAEALLAATREYASACMGKRGVAQLADSTGFSPEGVSRAMSGLRELEGRLTADDWMPDSLFGNEGRISDLFGVMLRVPQLKRQFADAVGASGGQGELSGIARDWVNGERLREIAVRYFGRATDSGDTRAITEACRTIYRAIASGGAWGLSALGALDRAGEDLDDDGRRQLSALPAMVYHGVRSEEGVLMRMNAVPRSVAVQVGELYRRADRGAGRQYTIGHARAFLQDMDAAAWGRVRPAGAALSGGDYRRVWRILSGEEL